MRSLPFGDFPSCLRRGWGELPIAPRGLRFILGGVILGGEGLTPTKAAAPAPAPESDKLCFKARFPDATGVLVGQSSGMMNAKSSRS